MTARTQGMSSSTKPLTQTEGQIAFQKQVQATLSQIAACNFGRTHHDDLLQQISDLNSAIHERAKSLDVVGTMPHLSSQPTELRREIMKTRGLVRVVLKQLQMQKDLVDSMLDAVGVSISEVVYDDTGRSSISLSSAVIRKGA